jgi:hypothetical protein
MRRLRPAIVSSEPDLRPGLLSLVCLLFILLPCLLLTTSLQRLTALGVGLASGRSSGSGAVVPARPGVIEDLEVRVEGQEILVRARLRTLDVRVGEGAGTVNETRVPPGVHGPDLATLQATLVELHRLDPDRRTARLVPGPETTTDTLMAVMDVLRLGPSGRLFDQVELGSAERAP